MSNPRRDPRPRCTDSTALPSRGERWARPIVVILALGVAALWQQVEPDPRSAGEGGPDSLTEADALVSVDLPLEVNDRVEKWKERFQTDQRQAFQRYLFRGEIYADMIREKLRERGMPQDLIYLALIESGFSPWATSRVSASGMWQFMSPTARAYGLRVDAWVDERRDPIRATDAALDYLEVLHERFGSWYLAAAAYNAGPTRVARVLRQHASDSSGDEEIYWEIIDQLPRETQAYVPKVLAATLLAREAEAHGFEIRSARSGAAQPYRFHRVFVPGGTALSMVAKALDVPTSTIVELNPHLIQRVTPPGLSYPVRVPVGRSGQVVTALGRELAVADDD